jgi:hypothetical protein
MSVELFQHLADSLTEIHDRLTDNHNATQVCIAEATERLHQQERDLHSLNLNIRSLEAHLSRIRVTPISDTGSQDWEHIPEQAPSVPPPQARIACIPQCLARPPTAVRKYYVVLEAAPGQNSGIYTDYSVYCDAVRDPTKYFCGRGKIPFAHGVEALSFVDEADAIGYWRANKGETVYWCWVSRR